MSTAETTTELPHRVHDIPDTLRLTCPHCHGTGDAPTIEILPEWRTTLAALGRAADKLAQYGGTRSTGPTREKYLDAVDEFRALLNESRDLHIPDRALVWATGFTRSHLDNIRKGRTGRPLREGS